MAKRRFEGSPADKAEDKRNARKAGVSVKKWEGSAGDMKADAAGQRKLDANAAKARAIGGKKRKKAK